MLRKCERCREEKEQFYFKGKKLVCKKCEREKLKTKIKKFEDKNLGLIALDCNLDKIYVIGKFFNFNYYTTVNDAVRLVENRIAQVYNSDTIYIVKSEEDIIIKEEVLERDRYICYYCGKFGNTVDHLVPKSKGGEYTHDNLVCACQKCNCKKDNISEEEFRDIKIRLRRERERKIEDIKRNKERDVNMKINEVVNRNVNNEMSKLDRMLQEVKNKNKCKWL